MGNLLKIRINTTIQLTIPLLTRGAATSLVGRDISVFLVNPYGKRIKMGNVTITGENENILEFIYEGKEQKYCGLYYVEVYENYYKNRMASLDAEAFILVQHTKDENDGVEGVAMAYVTLSALTISWSGADGVGIESIEQTYTSHQDDGINVITSTLTDGRTSQFTTKNGSKGTSGGFLYPTFALDGESGELVVSGVEAEVDRISVDSDTGELVIELNN